MASAEELINLGFSLHQDGKLEEAADAYNAALSIDKNNAEVYNLIGVLKLQQNKISEAIHCIEKAIEKSPQEYFYETLFQAYIRNSDYEKIISKEKIVNESFPENFSLFFNIALAYKNLGNNKKSIEFYDKALHINPMSYDAWFNLAHLYSVEAETKNALSALKICKKLRPNDDETEYFLSLAYMRLKDYKNGLHYFEKRLCRETAIATQNKTYPNKLRKDNIWNGKNIKDKTLFVYYEAGFGDVIMFSRYLSLAAKKCKKLIFMCQKQLLPLFRVNPQLGFNTIIDSFVPESQIDFDVHCPLLSLPYVLGLSGNDVFVFREGYLQYDKSLAEEYKTKFFNNDKIKIGIKWQGNTYYDLDRVIPTELFIPLINVDNTQFYSFQTFEGSEETSKLSNIIDIGKDLIDFSQTAAALSNLDLVICNDTSLAHLAGAMHIPCWIMLPYEVNWRWHSDLSVCDWYESIRLFRQKSLGNWKSVFDDILNEMKHD